jgi:hypothetical protein
MEIAVRGSIQVPIRVDNIGDLLNVQRGFFKAELVRSVSIPDALIAPATTCFALPARFVKQLKLHRFGTRKARTAGGFAFFGIYEPVRLTILDRDCTLDVVKVPDGCPVLVGSLPLRLLDLNIDPSGQRLGGNPDHDGHPMIDLA